MNERIEKNTHQLIESLDLPQDLFLGLPSLVFTGNRELYISNHKGILVYEQDCAVILTKHFQIHIHGRGLVIGSYSKDELVIKGYIHSMEFS